MGLEFYANSGFLQNVTEYFLSVCNILFYSCAGIWLSSSICTENVFAEVKYYRSPKNVMESPISCRLSISCSFWKTPEIDRSHGKTNLLSEAWLVRSPTT